jgi:hypothetical protein
MEMAAFETSNDPIEATKSTLRILILFAHPSLDCSEVNRPLAEVVRDLGGVTLVDFYAEYADFQIDIDRERAVEMVEYVRRNYPQVKIVARAYDVYHLYLLNKAGVDFAVREMFDGSLEIGKAALRAVGTHPFKVEKMSQTFRRHDQAGLDSFYGLWDENPVIARNRAFLARAKEHGETLKELMETERLQFHDRSERGWTPPPKGYAEKFEE